MARAWIRTRPRRRVRLRVRYHVLRRAPVLDLALRRARMGGPGADVRRVHGGVRGPGARRVAPGSPGVRDARTGGPVDGRRMDPRHVPARRVRVGTARVGPGGRAGAPARVGRGGVGALVRGRARVRAAAARVGAVGEWSPREGARARDVGGRRGRRPGRHPDARRGWSRDRCRRAAGGRRLGAASRRRRGRHRGRATQHRPPSEAGAAIPRTSWSGARERSIPVCRTIRAPWKR